MISNFLYDSETILPINDLMFKRIFWNKEHPDILIAFLKAVLKRKDPITSVELMNTEMDDQFIGKHGIRLDLLGRTNKGELLNVEMQNSNNGNMFKRSLYYWSKVYSSQLVKGGDYKNLVPVIAINILDFNLFEDKRCHRNFILKDEETNEAGDRLLELHFIELRKRQYMNQNDELWAWAEFLKVPNSENIETEEKTENNKAILNAKEVFDIATADPIEREKIRLLTKTINDNESKINFTKIEIAKNLLTMNLSFEQISKATGLSIEEVKMLYDKM